MVFVKRIYNNPLYLKHTYVAELQFSFLVFGVVQSLNFSIVVSVCLFAIMLLDLILFFYRNVTCFIFNVVLRDTIILITINIRTTHAIEERLTVENMVDR